MFQCYKWFWSCLPLCTAACLHSVSYITLFFLHPHAGNPTIQTQDSWLSFEFHIWNSFPQDLRHCSTLSSFKAKLKTFLFSQYFHPTWARYRTPPPPPPPPRPPPPPPPPGIFGDNVFWIAQYVSFQYLLVCKMNYSDFRDYRIWYLAA